ncbi:MAG: hypothetical protein V1907_03765 [Candidatus Kerfeldbacteria bacterium]
MKKTHAITKAERRERRKKPTMKVSGASVKTLQRIIATRKNVDRGG